MKSLVATYLLAAGFCLANFPVWAESRYGPGVSDTEIRLGNTSPYSGATSPYGTVGKSEAAYFRMLNDQSGINGRRINFISRDDGSSPPKTLEMVRKLIEQDQTLLILSALGTPPNTAIWSYLNENKIPQLFAVSGADKWNDPKNHPWTMGWLPSYRIEARIYARYILDNVSDARIAVLYENDDFGKDYLTGLREGLGASANKMIVAFESYELTDPSVDSQIVRLHSSGATVLLTAASAKMAAQTIRKIHELSWNPTHFLTNVATSVKAVMQPAGPDKAVGVISAGFLKDPTDPQWQETQEYKDWADWMKKYNSSASSADVLTVWGYSMAQTMAVVLRNCGDDLTRDSVMRQAANLHDLKLPMLLPGITISTSADDFAPIKQMQLMRFNGSNWEFFGKIISGSGSAD
jgi:branched-chain amino acid transport system substrate-binding protein